MKPFAKLILTALVLPGLLIAAACSGGDSASDGNGEAIIIDALLPLSGALASYGETSQAALDEAVAAINQQGGPRVQLLLDDTRSDPAVALERLQAMHGRGAKIVIGPYSSAEVARVKDFADQNGIILISPRSTATTLAIPNDNVFRFTPDDEAEAVAVANLMYADGIRVVLPITRDDEGNRGLQTAVERHFEAVGGRVLEGIVYGTGVREFSAQVRELESRLASARQGGQEVGIYLTAFNEVVALFNAANASETLKGVKWYGSDSVALIRELVEDRTGAAFAAAAYYPNPIMGLSDADRALWAPVSERVAAKVRRPADAFAFAAYDALQVAYQTLRSNPNAGVEALKRDLVANAARHRGLTGSTELNAAGDRAVAAYDFWGICARGSGFEWARVASFSPAAPAANRVQRYPC